MIIIAQKYGQLGNRLAFLRTIISFALENNVKILDLSFDEYARHFTATNGNIIRINHIASKILRKILIKFIDLGVITNNKFILSSAKPDAASYIRLNDSDIINQCIASNVVVYDGWPIVDYNVLKKYDTEVKNYFTIKTNKSNKVNTFIDNARKDTDTLIGIHIRQGDYKNWNNGKYYYETKDYIKIINTVIGFHKQNRIKFIVSSNEPQDWELFSSIPYIKAPGDIVEDMYILAGCDEIYGPQSSYSGWASFYGNVPLCWIEDPRSFNQAARSTG